MSILFWSTGHGGKKNQPNQKPDKNTHKTVP